MLTVYMTCVRPWTLDPAATKHETDEPEHLRELGVLLLGDIEPRGRVSVGGWCREAR